MFFATNTFAQWKKIRQFNKEILTVYFLDSSLNSQVGFVSESKNDTDTNGLVWRTSDGGKTWNKVLHIPGRVRDFTFKDNLTGWLASQYVTPSIGYAVHKTTDGGVSWNPLTSSTIDGAAGIFYNPSIKILLLGDNDGHFSKDEGLTWSLINSEAQQVGFSFFNDMEGITGDSRNPDCLLFTNDGGLTWKTGFGRASYIDESYQPLALKNSVSTTLEYQL